MADFLYYLSIIIFLVLTMVLTFNCGMELGIIPYKPFIPGRIRSIFKSFSKSLSNFYSRLDSNTRIFINILAALLLTRIVLYFVAYLGYRVFGSDTRSFFTVFSDIWNRCDSPRYLQIASEGYLPTGERDKVLNLGFMPV